MMMDAETPLLQARAVGKSYGRHVGCLEVTFDLWPGEVLGEHHVRFGPVEYERTGKHELTVWVELGEGDDAQSSELSFKRKE